MQNYEQIRIDFLNVSYGEYKATSTEVSYNMPRIAARTDANQREIVEAFRSLGWSVACTHAVGAGFPDLVVGKGGINILVEIKDGKKPKSAQKLTKDQVKFFDGWRGNAVVVRSTEDVMAINAEKK